MILHICQEAERFQYGVNFASLVLKTQTKQILYDLLTGFHWENFSFIKAKESGNAVKIPVVLCLAS